MSSPQAVRRQLLNVGKKHRFQEFVYQLSNNDARVRMIEIENQYPEHESETNKDRYIVIHVIRGYGYIEIHDVSSGKNPQRLSEDDIIVIERYQSFRFYDCSTLHILLTHIY